MKTTDIKEFDFQKVLFVGPDFNFRKGGIASVLKVYSEEFNGFRFFGSTQYESAWLSFLFLPIRYLIFCYILFSNREIEIVHIHGASRGSFYRKYGFFIIGKYLFKKKVIYHIHGAEYHLFIDESHSFVKKQIRFMLTRVDELVVLSPEWKMFFEEKFAVKNVSVINNVIRKVANDTEREFSENDGIDLLFLGRIGKRKGIFDLLEVIGQNKTIWRKKLRLVVGGDGEVSLLQQRIEQLEIEELVNYVGWVSGQEKSLLLKSSHILILPSYNEGLPISILEAMSYKMPVISSDVGGIPQVLTNDVNGKVVSPGDLTNLGKAIDYYLQNPSQITVHGQKGYEIVSPFFPEQVKISLGKIYSKLLQ